MFTISPSPPPPPEVAAGDVTVLKKRRRPAGTPDPDAEVVSLSPRTLLESDRYVCEICNQGFQRDQNLQMHRRRHKVPWKLLKRDTAAEASGPARKRVFVCPEPTCLHHDPCHALGDLVGIKKHFRRKHSAHKQWCCSRCSKSYAVQSDYKAHLKTCGTRGHSCDCGRIFSRVETFIEHQDTCSASRTRAEPRTPQQPAALSRTASSPSTSTDTRPGGPPVQPTATGDPGPAWPYPSMPPATHHSLELQLLPPSISDDDAADLHLSIGPPARRVDWDTRDGVMETREQARQQREMAERELAAARRIRQQAQAEFHKACALRAAASRQINSVLLQITCRDCQQRLQPKPAADGDGGEEVQPQP